MIKGRCHRRKRKMGSGRGCEIEGRPQPGSASSARIVTAEQPVVGDKSCSVDIDLYSQVGKALCERSPYDVSEDTLSLVPVVPNLPSALASLLKLSDSRKRQKKSHSVLDAKSSRPGEKPHSKNIWVETGEYFRNLTLPDIGNLFEVSSVSSFANKNCFAIPVCENVFEGNAHSGNNNLSSITKEVKDDEILTEADTVGAEGLAQEEKENSGSNLPGGLQWLLACRNKIYLTSEPPSKKQKLLGGNAGFEKVLIACPCNGNSSLCNFCCMGEPRRGLNPLTVCNSCNVAVHRKCYGVPEDIEGSWLCSWCKQKVDDSDSVKGSCVLCPKQGGALKPVHRDIDSGGSTEFAHLFCCQWMPEVYIADMKVMEPIMNVEGIKETRKKLVCNICKVKRGACVRCSHGTCRTSFHPICAREARHRMEIWGKYGCDNVELRGFCSKHSEIRETNSTARSSNPTDSSGGNCRIPVNSSVKMPELDVSCCDGDNAVDHMIAADAMLDKSLSGELTKPEMIETINNGSVNSFDQTYLLILKKLIDRGKVSVKDVASEIGISPDSLVATLSADSQDRELQCEIVKWFEKNIYLGTSQQNLKTRSAVLSKAETGSADGSDGEVSEAENSVTVAVKSVPPRRRTKSNLQIVRDNKLLCTSNKISCSNGRLFEKPFGDDPDGASEVSTHDATDEKIVEPYLAQDSLAAHSPRCEAKPPNCSLYESGRSDIVTVSSHIVLTNSDQRSPVSAFVNHVPNIIKTEVSRFYIHPFIGKKLSQMECGVSENQNTFSVEEKVCHVEPSSNKINCCNDKKLEQLVKAKDMGVLELSPDNEVEGEIIYFQHRLLSNVVKRKRFTENLMCKIVKSLPQEIDAARTQRWDTVLVNQYLCELREAKKLGRKERRHKEAQAVLAAATAAAAASSRVSSFRVDALDEPTHPEVHGLPKLNNVRGDSFSQLIPRPKKTLSRVVVPRKEHPRSCDICRRPETILNSILVCSSCKVAVHLDCYCSVKESTGPWHCEICEELSSDRCAGAHVGNFLQKPFVAECDLCGGTAGAFRKSTGGQWVHAFCAEWALESTFRRGQLNPVEGMETLSKGINVCCICCGKHGVCVKCSYGHCQTTFHPSCARTADYYMSVKTGGGKLQHKAYCENHSKEQRAKAETQRHGMEELKSIKQIRVELERLRLICERIIKREKVKRELVQQSHAILALKREEEAHSVLVHNPIFSPDVSSESATTSVKGNADGYRSCSEAAVHRSDNISIDSSVSHKRGFRAPVTNTEQKMDGSTFQNFFTRRTTERSSFSGKKVAHRHSITSHNVPDDEERNLKCRKHTETFEKELVMTSDQASMRNQQLPKGYVYVPVDRLPKEQIDRDGSSGGQLENDE